ncbi:hypothetical protein WICPIJ_008586 [Wickerhamomyces pijperi]|uniref:Uncharacterized protein n=1 Tax=Wickerhamomyces pijperi TaxID=599730 RepID=A0A9P8PWN2_WICPI|nr:hypothetical protein WICPIJ_008586 [Wickerhamomyces pijperi]
MVSSKLAEWKSRTSPTLMFTTPRKPWSFFLNFFWSKTWTDNTEFSLTKKSKVSFQYGFRVFLAAAVDLVCSPSTVRTPKGSGERNTSLL